MIRSIHWNANRAKAAAVASVAMILSTAVVFALRPSQEVARDFFQDYASARNLLAGKPVYRPMEESLHEYLEQDLTPAVVLYNAHPPTAVLLAIPFALTDYVSASVLWSYFSLIALAGSLAVLSSQLKWVLSSADWMLLMVAFAAWPPLWFHISSGQFGLLLLFLLTLAWKAGRSGQDAYAGWLIGLAAAIKIFPAILLLYFALRGRWRAVIAGALSIVLVTGLTLVLTGPQAYRDYVGVLQDLAAVHNKRWNASLPGFFSRIFTPPLSRLLILVSSGVIVTVIVKTTRRAAVDFDREFCLALTGSLLLSAYTWQHSFVLLLLPLAICIARFSYAGQTARYLLIGSWILMALPEPLLPGFDAGPSTAQALGVLSVNFYGLLAFFIAQTRFREGWDGTPAYRMAVS